MNYFSRRYNFFGDYLISKYGCHILKLPVNMELSCPNRDGSLDTKGCIFCCEDGSSANSSRDAGSIAEQMRRGKESFKRGSYEMKYIAYFQAYTNTYSDINTLKKYYREAVEYDDSIIGLMIGTRPDCVDERIADMIASFGSDNFELWVELGIQSANEKSLKFLNRHHDVKSSVNAMRLMKERKIKGCAHLIIGIPGESWEDMMRSADFMNEINADGVKLHQLHVIKNTPLEKIYLEKKIELISFKDYVSTVCDMLERISPEVLIHRLSADRDRESLVAPNWGLHKGSIHKEIEDEFLRRETWQGFLKSQL